MSYFKPKNTEWVPLRCQALCCPSGTYLPDATSYCCSEFSTDSHFTWSKSSSHYDSLQDLKRPPSHPYLSDLFFCNSPSYSLPKATWASLLSCDHAASSAWVPSHWLFPPLHPECPFPTVANFLTFCKCLLKYYFSTRLKLTLLLKTARLRQHVWSPFLPYPKFSFSAALITYCFGPVP